MVRHIKFHASNISWIFLKSFNTQFSTAYVFDDNMEQKIILYVTQLN